MKKENNVIRKIKFRQTWILPLVLAVFTNAGLFAQQDEWETTKTKDGQITVQSNVTRRIGTDGKKEQLIEFAASTVADININNLTALLNDVDAHKDFNDDSESRIIKTLSANEWIIYYYSKVSWPFSDFDGVYRMKFSKDDLAGKTVFSLSAEPDLFEMQKVDRVMSSNVTYEFTDIGDNKTEIVLSAATCPTIVVPDWLIKQSFPDGPAQILSKMILLAKTNYYKGESLK